MAAFKIMQGPSSRIDTKITPYHEGYAWFTPDDGKFYIDATVSADSDNSPAAVKAADVLGVGIDWSAADENGNVTMYLSIPGVTQPGQFKLTVNQDTTVDEVISQLGTLRGGRFANLFQYDETSGEYTLAEGAEDYSLVQMYTESTVSITFGAIIDDISNLAVNSELRICINPDAPRILLSTIQPSDLTEQDIWYKEVT